MINISAIIHKLDAAGLVKKHAKGIGGDFDIQDHGHILNKEELKSWIETLHGSMPDCNDKCTGLHRWNIDFIQ
jgi:hypothetical protein